MMYTDYKISSLLDNGIQTIVTVQFYEGSYQDIFDKVKEIWKTIYVRTNLLKPATYKWKGSLSLIEVQKLLNTELTLDLTRTPINEQKVLT